MTKGSARDWKTRESIVDHPGPYRLRLIAAGTAEEIIISVEHVLAELKASAPRLDDLNAGSALCDWDIEATVDTPDYNQLARDRVEETPELKAWEETIFYSWPNWDEHVEWVATAPVDEIVSWAQHVEKAAE